MVRMRSGSIPIKGSTTQEGAVSKRKLRDSPILMPENEKSGSEEPENSVKLVL
jgi:hypothetical protein